MRFLFLIVLFSCSSVYYGQEDLLQILDSAASQAENEPVQATWKTTRIVNANTTETVRKGLMDFRITHRFGNIGEASNGGAHTLWGFDNSADIRFSFDFGITDKLTIGVGRSKAQELIDGNLKWRFLEQTTNNKIPFTAAFYSTIALNPQVQEQFYFGVEDSLLNKKFVHRMSYVTQLILARKFGPVSFELLPTYSHRNFVRADVNPNNNAVEENGIFSLGAGARVKITKRAALLFDYFHVFSEFREGNDNFRAPFGIGYEVETGGHVFHINITNASGIIENYFIPNTTDNWLEGGYKLGFTISRVFRVKKKKHSTADSSTVF